MKKVSMLLVLIALSPTLLACQDKEHSIPLIENYDSLIAGINASYDITVDDLQKLLDSKQSFMMEFYRPSCEHCITLGEILDTHMKEKGYPLYRLNCEKLSSTEEFLEKYVTPFPDFFTPNTGVPQIYFVSNGKLTYQVNTNKLSSYTAFTNIANKHFLSSSLKTFTTEEGFKAALNQNDELLIYNLNINDANSWTYYHDYCLNGPLLNANKNTLIINNNFSKVEYLTNYEIDPSKNEAYIFSKEKKIKTIDLSTDGNYFKDFVNYYLGLSSSD